MNRTKQERDEIAAAALEDMRLAYGMRRAHARLAAWAGRRYGDHGPLISGVVRGHFPDQIKTALRLLAQATGEHFEHSREGWRAAGRKRATWCRAKYERIAWDGRGYYG